MKLREENNSLFTKLFNKVFFLLIHLKDFPARNRKAPTYGIGKNLLPR